MNSQRRNAVNNYIQQKGEAKLSELESIFTDVSAMTLRRDLQYLEEKGHIVRVRGGAKSISSLSKPKETMYSYRESENIDAKVEIARKAVDLIETGRSLYLDSGTTIMCLARIIPNNKLFIITSGPNIGLELSKNNKVAVNLTGGQLNTDTLSVSGSNSLSFIDNINIDIAFMATSGFSLDSGFTSGNIDECELKKRVINKARKVIMLMDTSKIDKNMPFTFATLKDIDILVSDKHFPEELKSVANINNVDIL